MCVMIHRRLCVKKNRYEGILPPCICFCFLCIPIVISVPYVFFHVMPVTPPFHHLFRILVKYLPHIFFPALFLYIRCCLLHLRRSVLFIVCIGSDAVYQFFVQKCSYEFLNLSSCAASDAVCVDLYVHAHIVKFSYSLL